MPAAMASYVRIFKTAWFAKAAGKARLSDDALRAAVAEAVLGQADDLGGGVYKKRLGRNLYRSIVLARGRRCWVYVYLFAKKDRANIETAELRAIRDLADLYAGKTDADLAREMEFGELLEITGEG